MKPPALAHNGDRNQVPIHHRASAPQTFPIALTHSFPPTCSYIPPPSAAGEPGVFATASFDGRVSLHNVAQCTLGKLVETVHADFSVSHEPSGEWRYVERVMFVNGDG